MAKSRQRKYDVGHLPPVVRPGDPMLCADGHDSNGMPSVPLEAPASAWLVRCTRCGWCAYLRPHFGDRPQDLCYVVEEVPAEVRRTHALFIEAGLKPWA